MGLDISWILASSYLSCDWSSRKFKLFRILQLRSLKTWKDELTINILGLVMYLCNVLLLVSLCGLFFNIFIFLSNIIFQSIFRLSQTCLIASY